MGDKKLNFVLLLFATVVILSAISIPGETFAAKGGLSGTSLEVTKTVETEFIREYTWNIEKSVSPDTIDMFSGDSAATTYTIDVTKTATDIFVMSGEICVSNIGSFATTGLTIVDQAEYRIGNSKYQSIPGASQTIIPAQLESGETECYPYNIEFTPIPDAKYRNSVKVTITNHGGKVGTAFGPLVKEDATFPLEPTIVGFDSVEVQDTYGGQFLFSDTGSQSYETTFSCDSDDGSNINTATITETGQSDSASLTVNCYSLDVTKDAETSFTRQYNWYIAKLADISSVSGPPGFEQTVNYDIYLSELQPDDSEFEVQGLITVYNPSPIDATIASISDVVSPSINAVVDCGVSFPYSLVSGDTLNCTYSATLPNSITRTNTATVTLQNHDYDSEGSPTDSGTTDFTGTAEVEFDSNPTNEIDECADVSDSLVGYLGQVCVGDPSPQFSYPVQVEDYIDTDEPGLNTTLENTASFTTNDTGSSGSSDHIVYVLVFDES